MKKIFISLFLLSFLLNSCMGQTSKNIKTIPPKEFITKINSTKNAQIVDVRSPEEFSKQHLEKAKNINWNGGSFESQIQLLDKKAPVFVYCQAGGRSSKAVSKMNELGFTEIYEMQGGMANCDALLINNSDN
jgi:rhodanese-related sulfurtransferase